MKFNFSNKILILIVFCYFITALIGTNNHALFNGDNAANLVQANYVRENPNQIFGWSRISYAGYPLFFFFQPLSHLILALFFSFGNIFLVYKTFLIVLFSAIPVSFFYSLRRIGFGKKFVLFSSVQPLLITSFTGFGLEPASIFAWGLFTQLFATVLFPITISKLYFSIKSKKNFFSSVSLLSVTILVHPIIGVLCVFVGFLVAILILSEFRQRVLNLIRILLFSFVVVSFWGIPILVYKELYGGVLKSNEYLHSFGFFKVFSGLVSGGILDASSFVPFLSLSAIAGFFLIAHLFFERISFNLTSIKKLLSDKQSEKERFILFGLIISFILFSGGNYMFKIPVLSFFELHRFIFIFHFFLILASSFYLEYVVIRFGKKSLYSIVFIIIFLIISSFNETYDRQKAINNQNPVKELIEVASYLHSFPEGRAYVQSLDFEPIKALFFYYSKKPILLGFIGSHTTLSTKYIHNLTLSNKEDLERYNVKYLILNSSVNLSFPKKVFDNLTVYFVNSSGYFYVDENCGLILSESNGNEKYFLNVELNSSCKVLFKMSYSPFWKASVEGESLKINSSEDSLISFNLEKGSSSIKLEYEDVSYRKSLFIIGLLVLFGLFIHENNFNKDGV